MAAIVRFVLRYRLGTENWIERPLEEGDILIGREEGMDLVLNHDLVSRQHARLRRHGDEVWLTDLGSTNGTVLDNVRLSAHTHYPVKPGQSMKIGGFYLQIETITSTQLTVQESVQPAQQLAGQGLARPMPPVVVPPPVIAAPSVKPVPDPRAIKPNYGLYYRRGNDNWQTLPLIQGEIVIGRNPDCQLILDDREVSRRHARLEHTGDQFWLLELGSTNGTQLDGEPLAPRRRYSLNPGQTFQVGSYILFVSELGHAAGRGEQGAPTPRQAPITPGTPAMEAGEQAAVKTMLIQEADILQAPAVVHSLDLGKYDRITFGRSQDNHVVLNHPLVSRYHAAIERIGGRYLLRDLRSTNGVFVNSKRAANETWLREADEIRIGPFVFELSGFNLRQKAETGLLLQVHGVKQFVSKQMNLLQDINLVIQPFEFVAIVGMSGSGKTTLMNAISGYRPASDGKVLVNQSDLYSNYDLFRNDIGYVPQKDIVHTELTPESALEYVARLRMPPDTSPAERSAVVTEVLDNLGLSERRNVPISRLSGGQLKRVSIGVELVTKPRLFFLDEPTSGLDPGTEYGMMKLLRRLADQGRTVILVTHATKNVMLCDKVVFLAAGGHLAHYGPPDEALQYFDKFRTDRERKEKEMEFDDIYRILSDDERGTSVSWDRRYRNSPAYQGYARPVEAGQVESQAQLAVGAKQLRRGQAIESSKRQRNSAFRQFLILSARNLTILTQDKVSLGLMLALAPILGLMDFIWGPDLFDPVLGDAAKIITMWFMMGLICILVGALSSVREIVKEADIYQRERAVNLKILPYVLSKVWVGVVLGLYQAAVLLLAKLIFVHPELSGAMAYIQLFVTIFLGTVCGYLIGLAISAGAPNQNAAMLLIIVVLVPQFLFAGALLPLDLIPGGEKISLIMPTRWVFESFIRINGLGDSLVNDPCWDYSKAERLGLSEAEKANCTCLGENIFTRCATFPGILSPDFYNSKAQEALAKAEPVVPPNPTAYPYPTAYPTPAPLPTPTLLPSPTPLPTPADPRDMGTYMDQRSAQGQEYQDQILGQFDAYRLDSQEQGQAYSDVRTEQGDEYASSREAQGDEYAEEMRIYGDERADWQENREKAISSAEGVLGAIYDNYAHTMKGSLLNRWLALVLINTVLLVIVLVFQKRKDLV
jgi:ABC-type multidrug transport system ATPase subunit/pSer/pThr/pTyr-binding forkhead associated (FHA) protein